MKKSFTWRDQLYLIGIVAFLFSCVASTHRTARTLQPGQFSGSAAYSNMRSVENFSEGSIDLITTDARVGVTKGLDLGLTHTWDVTSDHENAYGTLWGDVKVQATNRNNEIGKVIFSTGLIKGYLYDPDVKAHVTTLPLMFSIPATPTITPSFSYHFQVISEDFIPDGDALKDPYHHFALGSEFSLIDPIKGKWTPKLGISVGYINSFKEGDSGMLILNGGIIVDSPFKPYKKKEK